MRIIREKLKVLRGYLAYGEIKYMAQQNNMPIDRAYEIARGRQSPRDSEMGFVNAIIDRVTPRMQQTSRLNNLKA